MAVGISNVGQQPVNPGIGIGNQLGQNPLAAPAGAPAHAGAANGAGAIPGPMQMGNRRAAAAARNGGNIAGAAQPGRTGFLAAIKNFFTRDTGGSIPDTLNFTLNDGTHLTMQGAQFNKMISSLPKAARGQAIANLQQTMTARMNRGKEIMTSVLNTGAGPNGLPPGEQEVSDLTLYLYARAASQGENFSNGSFSIADPNGHLARYLDSSPERYVRGSSHHKALQGEIVDGHVNMHRGIDVKRGMNGLPCGHQTVLFATVPANADLGTGRRLFLKAESAGCRISLMKAQVRLEATGGDSDREVRARDVGQSVRHFFSFIITRFQKNIGGARKEHMPPPVGKALDAVIKEGRKSGNPALIECAAYLQRKDLCAGGHGLRALMKELNNYGISITNNVVSTGAPAPGFETHGLTSDDVRTFLQPVLDAVLAENLDNLNIRTGREVLIG